MQRINIKSRLQSWIISAAIALEQRNSEKARTTLSSEFSFCFDSFSFRYYQNANGVFNKKGIEKFTGLS